VNETPTRKPNVNETTDVISLRTYLLLTLAGWVGLGLVAAVLAASVRPAGGSPHPFYPAAVHAATQGR
jgi:hypothetical protein